MGVVELSTNSEVGALRVVILHRPGAELLRLNPRNVDELLFDGLPWVARAQDEHDLFAALLQSRGIEVLLLSDLLTEALTHSGAARMQGVAAAVDARRLGVPLAQEVSAYLRGLEPARLAQVLMAGMTFNELPSGTRTDVSLVLRMHHGGDFVIDPLPNLVFTRDSSIWIGRRVVIPTLALRARAREASLTDLIYAHHPRFTGVRRAYESRTAPVEGGDVLLLAPGVVAIGVGERTTPAGAEALARSLVDDDLANTVLAVPIAQRRAQMHLDTVCTMVDTDTVVMYANIVDSLSAFTLQRTPDGVAISDEATPGTGETSRRRESRARGAAASSMRWWWLCQGRWNSPRIWLPHVPSGRRPPGRPWYASTSPTRRTSMVSTPSEWWPTSSRPSSRAPK